ncbi:RNAse P Rpr2/Rpp21/SNM1 subunit domain-domain-containing protein [Coniella lustricola]|uniref:RNAse P Rpr2/Rpp21/SNM1 subunit domain-domain-containing protein n=1 Tax=Coniella lustricola TaxID=2025994 RepID=A0A2T3AE06_9PEZI|nr:RNAse P Rpr2/Rpp21/SNM1 subunit domain-domain-containing protein [Coniella lustricola]
MAKGKKPGVPNRHVFSRISFLYQAAAYLSMVDNNQQPSTSNSSSSNISEQPTETATAADFKAQSRTTSQEFASRRLLTDLRNVALKSQIRISPAVKRTVCKYCDSLLVEGQTCSSVVENKSKGGRKPWADLLVVSCHTCGRERRYPVSSQRPKRRHCRATAAEPAEPQQEDQT